MSKPFHPSMMGTVEPARGAFLGLPLLSLSLGTLLSSLGTSIANVGLPTFMEVFGASLQQVQWIVIAYLLAVTTLVVGVGRLGDMIGRRKLLLAGIALFTLASALCAMAPTLATLIAARALQGAGAATMMALSMALVGETIAKSNTGAAMGLLGTMSAIGTALGPSLGGILISTFGWQAIFLIQVPFGVFTFGLAYRSLKPGTVAKTAAGFDFIGMLVLASTLLAYALAMTVGRGSFGLQNVILLGAAAGGLAAFIWIEARTQSPLLKLTVFGDAALNSALAASLLVSAVMMTTLVVGPFYLSRGLELNAAWIGLVIAIGPVVVALSGVPAGRLADRYGAGRITAVGLSAMALGSVLLALMPITMGVTGYAGALVIITSGYALFQTANNAGVMVDIPADRRGVISGVLNLSRNIGLITGASIMTAIFAGASATFGKGMTSQQAASAGMRVTFVFAAILVTMALAIAARGRSAARGGAA